MISGEERTKFQVAHFKRSDSAEPSWCRRTRGRPTRQIFDGLKHSDRATLAGNGHNRMQGRWLRKCWTCSNNL